MLWHHVQSIAAAPTSTPFFDTHSHRSITSYITFWLGLEARFQLTGACDRALTVLTYIFPSSRDPSPPLPSCRPSLSPSISPYPSLPLHTLQESSRGGSQTQTWVGQVFLWRAQTCIQTERMTHKGNSWCLSSIFYSDKWHNAYKGEHKMFDFVWHSR